MELQQSKLKQVEQQLYEWDIPQSLWSCARSRGMSAHEFAIFWRTFVRTNVNKRNWQGQLVLTNFYRAQLRGFLALRDAGWPSTQSRLQRDPEWVPATVRSRSGKDLGWRVFTNAGARRRAVGWRKGQAALLPTA
jgi:hypothetical protein